MIRKERDVYRWRRRFALFPRKIGTQWIWLERYAWRYLTTEDVLPLLKKLYLVGPLRISTWSEFTIKEPGYTVWRETVYPMLAMCPPSHYWHTPLPRLRAVS